MNKVVLCAVCLGLIVTVTCATYCDPRNEALEVNSAIANLSLSCKDIHPDVFFVAVTLEGVGAFDDANVTYVCHNESNGVLQTNTYQAPSSSSGLSRNRVPFTPDVPLNVICEVTGCYTVGAEAYRFDTFSCCIVNNTEEPCLTSTTTTVTIVPSSTVHLSLQYTKSIDMTSSQSVSYSSAIVPSNSTTPSPDSDDRWFLFLGLVFLAIAISLLIVLLFVCVTMVDKHKRNKMLMKMRLGHGLYLHTTQIVDSEGMFDDVADTDVQLFKINIYKEQDCVSVFDPFYNKEDFCSLSRPDNGTDYLTPVVDNGVIIGTSQSDMSFQTKAREDTSSSFNSDCTLDDMGQTIHDEIEAAVATVGGISKEDTVSMEECNNNNFEVDKSAGNESLPVSPLQLTQQNPSLSSGYVLSPTSQDLDNRQTYPDFTLEDGLDLDNHQTYPDFPLEGGLDLDSLSVLSEKDEVIQRGSGYIATTIEQTSVPLVTTDTEEIDFSISDDLSLDYRPIEEDSEVSPVPQDEKTILATDTDYEPQSISCSLTSLEQLTPGNSTAISEGYIGSESVTLFSHVIHNSGHPETSSEYFSQSKLLNTGSVSSDFPHNGYVRNKSLSPCTTVMTEEDLTNVILESPHDMLYTDEHCHSTQVCDPEGFSIAEQWDTMLPIDLDIQSDPEYKFINTSGSENTELHSNTGYIVMDKP